MPLKTAPAFAYTAGELTIAANQDQFLKVQAKLEKSTLVVFENMQMAEVVKALTNELGLKIIVDESRASKFVTVFSDQEAASSLVRKLSEASDSFLVYRNGYLLYTGNAHFKLKLSRELTPQELSQLAEKVHGQNVKFEISKTNVDATASRAGFQILRQFLIAEAVTATIQFTDTVAEKF